MTEWMKFAEHVNVFISKVELRFMKHFLRKWSILNHLAPFTAAAASTTFREPAAPGEVCHAAGTFPVSHDPGKISPYQIRYQDIRY